MKLIKHFCVRALDVMLSPLALVSSILLCGVRRFGVHRLRWCRSALLIGGAFPIRKHYYEPLYDVEHLRGKSIESRRLPGIDWAIPQQLSYLNELQFTNELPTVLAKSEEPPRQKNTMFGAGDAEFWYQVVRRHKPKRIVEVGSGHSTLLAIEAVLRNRKESSEYHCDHVCIEPYEVPWLEGTGVRVLREKVEDVGTSLFTALERDDILFIDSSHVIRPGGDVLFEILELLPLLQSGVVVHIHDVFSPRDYPERWLVDEVRLWNEQYLLEAFLTHNSEWTILAALNLLSHEYAPALRSICPQLDELSEPGSIYLRRK